MAGLVVGSMTGGSPAAHAESPLPERPTFKVPGRASLPPGVVSAWSALRDTSRIPDSERAYEAERQGVLRIIALMEMYLQESDLELRIDRRSVDGGENNGRVLRMAISVDGALATQLWSPRFPRNATRLLNTVPEPRRRPLHPGLLDPDA